MVEHNKLTKRLLAEGYDEEHHPEYVRWDKSSGDFEYLYYYAAERVYETSCGILCKGSSTITGMWWMGEEWTHENDQPFIRCPKECMNCELRDDPFRNAGDNIMKFSCPCHLTDRTYEYKGSYEELEEIRHGLIRDDEERFLNEHKRACRHHVRWNPETQKHEFHYDPDTCRNMNCIGKECPVLGKVISNQKANIYFDLEFEGRDYSQDGTFWDGKRFREIVKGIQFFDKPIPYDIADAYLKVNKKFVFWLIKVNKLPHYYTALEILKMERGELDINWKVVNLRVEKKYVRDIDQDLEDIANGIHVEHEFDITRVKKAEKRERAEKRAAATTKAFENKIIKVGFDALSDAEKIRARKRFEPEKLLELNRLHEIKIAEEENRPVQMSLFDLFPGKEGDVGTVQM